VGQLLQISVALPAHLFEPACWDAESSISAKLALPSMHHPQVLLACLPELSNESTLQFSGCTDDRWLSSDEYEAACTAMRALNHIRTLRIDWHFMTPALKACQPLLYTLADSITQLPSLNCLALLRLSARVPQLETCLFWQRLACLKTLQSLEIVDADLSELHAECIAGLLGSLTGMHRIVLRPRCRQDGWPEVAKGPHVFDGTDLPMAVQQQAQLSHLELSLYGGALQQRTCDGVQIPLHHCTALQHLDLSFCRLGQEPDEALALGRSLSQLSSLTHLSLRGASLSGKAAGLLGCALQNMPNLSALDLQHITAFAHPSTCGALAERLATLPSLQQLQCSQEVLLAITSYSQCRQRATSMHKHHFPAIHSTNLRSLSLVGDGVQPPATRALCNVLALQTGLSELSLGFPLSGAAGTHLARCLQGLHSLQSLTVWRVALHSGPVAVGSSCLDAQACSSPCLDSAEPSTETSASSGAEHSKQVSTGAGAECPSEYTLLSAIAGCSRLRTLQLGVCACGAEAEEAARQLFAAACALPQLQRLSLAAAWHSVAQHKHLSQATAWHPAAQHAPSDPLPPMLPGNLLSHLLSALPHLEDLRLEGLDKLVGWQCTRWATRLTALGRMDLVGVSAGSMLLATLEHLPCLAELRLSHIVHGSGSPALTAILAALRALTRLEQLYVALGGISDCEAGSLAAAASGLTRLCVLDLSMVVMSAGAMCALVCAVRGHRRMERLTLYKQGHLRGPRTDKAAHQELQALVDAVPFVRYTPQYTDTKRLYACDDSVTLDESGRCAVARTAKVPCHQ
jgi:hypothetical protein